MKIIIFGAEGQLGRELVREFEGRGHEIHPVGRGSADITKQDQVQALFERHRPAWAVNSAAYNKVDLAEKEADIAYAVNGVAVRNLATACRNFGARLAHISTDYVFDGEAGRPYVEEDAVGPLSAYGISKLAGEYYARSYSERALVIRTSGVFGPAGAGTAGGNFVETMLRLEAKGGPIRVIADSVASPSYAPELARVTADLCGRGADGIFHAGGGEAISWFDYARAIFAAAGLAPDLAPSEPGQYRPPARRPRFSALANARLAKAGVAPFMPLKEALVDYFTRRPRSIPGGPAPSNSSLSS